jgi:hypothetical protein
MSAFDCSFNRSMQHLVSIRREEDVADEEVPRIGKPTTPAKVAVFLPCRLLLRDAQRAIRDVGQCIKIG